MNEVNDKASPIGGLVMCECHACIKEFDIKAGSDNSPFSQLPLSSSKMILCPDCGNKRCPKASDHRNECTSSNDTGQAGSIYT